MSHALPKLLGAAAVALLASSALAAPADYEPGVKWESTVEMEMPGMPMKMPPQTHEFCKPKKDWSEPPGSDPKKCKTTEMKRSANKMSWKVVCEGKEPMTGEGEMTYDAKSFSGSMKMTMSQGTMNMKMKGREIGGDCDANEMKRKVAAMTADAKEQQAKGEKMQAEHEAKACDEGVQRMQAMAFSGMMAYCKDPARKQEFCARMSTRDGFLALQRNNPESQRADAAKACGKDLAEVQASLCKQSRKDALSNQGSMSFLTTFCPEESQALAQKECAGLDYTSASPQQRSLCTTYARGAGKAKPAPASDTPKSADDALKKAAKGLIPGF
jgi:hypothetical protein